MKFYLLSGYDGQGFPIVQDQFDWALDAAMEEEYFGTAEGTQRKPKGSYYKGDECIAVYAAT